MILGYGPVAPTLNDRNPFDPLQADKARLDGADTLRGSCHSELILFCP